MINELLHFVGLLFYYLTMYISTLENSAIVKEILFLEEEDFFFFEIQQFK